MIVAWMVLVKDKMQKGLVVDAVETVFTTLEIEILEDVFLLSCLILHLLPYLLFVAVLLDAVTHILELDLVAKGVRW